MQKKFIRFIVNPFSGATSKKKLQETVYEMLDHSQYSYDYCLTEGPEHATELAKIAVDQDYYMVVAVGGDGTVNEVASALRDTNTILGIIPGGSGNGFAMYIGIGRNFKKAIKIINEGKVKEIDSCEVNNRFFINLAGIGFDARIAYKIKKSASRGLALYLRTIVKEAMNFEIKKFSLELDEGIIEDEYGVIVVANAAMYGYNFTIAPEAELKDGLFDVVMIKKASIFRYMMSSWRFLNGSIAKSNLVEIKKSKKAVIHSETGNYYHLDGEGYKSPTELRFKMFPNSIKVMFPPVSKN